MTSSTVESLHLDPPKFSFDEENEDLELWSFRLPVSLSVDALKGIKFDPLKGSGTFSADGKEYRIQLGDTAETDSFRVLVPQNKNSKANRGDDDDDESSSSSSGNSSNDDDDDEDEAGGTNGKSKKGKLRPCKVAFSKHFQVLASVPILTESQLAPLEGPPPADKMRHAYAPITQRSGLKRRWMPIGVPKVVDDKAKPKKRSVPSAKKEEAASKDEARDSVVKMEIDTPPSKRIKKEQADDSEDSDDDSSSSVGDKKLSKSERKAKKAEKKAAKKAKKEAKKAKKAAKKAKKEKSK